MKLARKLVFGLLIGIIAVLSVSAWLRVAREAELFDRDQQRDDLLVGRAIATAVGRAWRTEGAEEALALVRSFDQADEEVHVRWVWLDGQADEVTRPRLSIDELRGVAKGAEFSQRNDPLDLQLTYIPVKVPGTRVGGVELAESLEAARAYVRRAVWNAVVTTGVLLAMAAILASILGTYHVGRPVHQLVGKVRRIAAGDLFSPLMLRRADELGELATAINQMCDALFAANEAARRETTARLAAVEQVRHADRLTTVGKLASGIAHELGTPLNIVSGRAYMIAAREATGEEIYENARIVMEQTERITQIIRQLLDFARPRPVEKTSTDLFGIVTQTAVLLRPIAEKAGVKIGVAEPPSPALAVVDAGQMQQVVTNLIVNAIHACMGPKTTDVAGLAGNNGMVSVGFKTAVRPSPFQHDDSPVRHLRVSVQDTGHGMDSETQARIFDPFFTTKEVGEGTGLGLSIVYGIVRDHGGWLDVESAPGAGTTVTFCIPLTDEEKAGLS